METVETSRKLVQHMLQAHANEKGEAEGVEVQLVFDTVNDHYQLQYIGWQGEHVSAAVCYRSILKTGRYGSSMMGPKRVSRAH